MQDPARAGARAAVAALWCPGAASGSGHCAASRPSYESSSPDRCAGCTVDLLVRQAPACSPATLIVGSPHGQVASASDSPSANSSFARSLSKPKIREVPALERDFVRVEAVEVFVLSSDRSLPTACSNPVTDSASQLSRFASVIVARLTGDVDEPRAS